MLFHHICLIVRIHMANKFFMSAYLLSKTILVAWDRKQDKEIGKAVFTYLGLNSIGAR